MAAPLLPGIQSQLAATSRSYICMRGEAKRKYLGERERYRGRCAPMPPGSTRADYPKLFSSSYTSVWNISEYPLKGSTSRGRSLSSFFTYYVTFRSSYRATNAKGVQCNPQRERRNTCTWWGLPDEQGERSFRLSPADLLKPGIAVPTILP